MHSMRTKVARFVLAAMLLSLPGGASAGPVCLRGVSASRTCPLCRAHASAAPRASARTSATGAAYSSGCCRFAAREDASDVALRPAPVETQAHAAAIVSAAAVVAPVAPYAAQVVARARAGPRTPADFLSSILRL